MTSNGMKLFHMFVKTRHNMFLIIINLKSVFKEGSSGGFKPPPPPPSEIFRFFLKSEGKAIERKRKKRDAGGGLPLNIFSYFWG